MPDEVSISTEQLPPGKSRCPHCKTVHGIESSKIHKPTTTDQDQAAVQSMMSDLGLERVQLSCPNCGAAYDMIQGPGASHLQAPLERSAQSGNKPITRITTTRTKLPVIIPNYESAPKTKFHKTMIEVDIPDTWVLQKSEQVPSRRLLGLIGRGTSTFIFSTGRSVLNVDLQACLFQEEELHRSLNVKYSSPKESCEQAKKAIQQLYLVDKVIEKFAEDKRDLKKDSESYFNYTFVALLRPRPVGLRKKLLGLLRKELPAEKLWIEESFNLFRFRVTVSSYSSVWEREGNERANDLMVNQLKVALRAFTIIENGADGLLDEQGRRTGCWVFYDANGWKKAEREYIKGKQSGKAIDWYENGQKKAEGLYVDDKGSGVWIDWYENGQKKSEGQWVDNKRNGVWTFWNENGQKESQGLYVNNKKDGVWTYWRENGQKKMEGQWLDNKKNGLWVDWHENGQKWSEGHYVDDKGNGVGINWHENGQKESEGQWVDSKQDGVWTYWYENGQKKSEGLYVDNKRDGSWTFWNERGELVQSL